MAEAAATKGTAVRELILGMVNSVTGGTDETERAAGAVRLGSARGQRRVRGSSASRTLSPSRLKARTKSRIVTPGKTM